MMSNVKIKKETLEFPAKANNISISRRAVSGNAQPWLK